LNHYRKYAPDPGSIIIKATEYTLFSDRNQVCINMYHAVAYGAPAFATHSNMLTVFLWLQAVQWSHQIHLQPVLRERYPHQGL